jgi:hypothetical protein
MTTKKRKRRYELVGRGDAEGRVFIVYADHAKHARAIAGGAGFKTDPARRIPSLEHESLESAAASWEAASGVRRKVVAP